MKTCVDVGIVRRTIAEPIGVDAHAIQNLRARPGAPIVADRQRSSQRAPRRALAHEHSAEARRQRSRRRRAMELKMYVPRRFGYCSCENAS